MRAWRRWCVSKYKNIQHCITTNCYWSIEINAHALINFIVLCRTKGYDFDVTLLQSQTCESFFRSARSLTSTESTVVNFNMQSFESRLSRIEAKIDIMHKQQDNFTFPRLKNIQTISKELPTNLQIIDIVQNAKNEAERLLQSLGIALCVDSFNECIYIRNPRSKCDVQTGNFEFVPVSMELNDDPSDEEECYDCENLISDTGLQLQVKNTSGFNQRNTFKIRNKNGRIVHIKKSTFIWTLQSETEKVSPDRLHRFQDSTVNESLLLTFQNKILNEVKIGEWVLITATSGFLVCKVYGFTYLSGKRLSYSRNSAPIHLPDGVEARGIGLKGAYFELTPFDGDFIVELLDDSDDICMAIESYKTHLKKPSPKAGLMLFDEDSVAYIKTYVN